MQKVLLVDVCMLYLSKRGLFYESLLFDERTKFLCHFWTEIWRQVQVVFNNWHRMLLPTKKRQNASKTKIKCHGRCKRLGWSGFNPTTFLQTKRALAHFEYTWSCRRWPCIKAAARHRTYKFLLMLRQNFPFAWWLSLTATKPVLPAAAQLPNSFSRGS